MTDAPASFRLAYPPELPVSARRDDLLDALRSNQVVVVAGETGSGKTTQLPKMLLELGRERIAHTQPRRIAARSVAERIAEELGVELGGVVGYRVRFDDRSGGDTRLRVMTDGVLLAELSRDRDLRRYDAIIIDEAHERSLTIDFLLGYLKRLLPRRPDLSVVITSATIDPESFARFFSDADGRAAPIIEVSGRTFPVEVRYRPRVPDADPDPDTDTDPSDDGASTSDDDTDALLAALDELAREEPGDVLVFLSGENEIRDAEDAVRGRYGDGTEVLPLYGRLSAEEQHRVFTARSARTRRRIVLATNVAETSLTVPGIRYVVDAGTARISRYSTRAKVQRLPIEPISRASANQRSGRAGRTSPGIAIRLYSEADLDRRPEFTDPEILRTNLAAVILQLLTLGLGDLEDFPFLQAPDPRGIRDGVDLLVELGAVTIDGVTGHRRVTRIGRELSRLPVDPRFGRILIEARRTGVLPAVLPIVAGLTVQDPRERPREKREQADAAHARFADPGSDFLAYLNLWRHLEEEQRSRSGSAFRRMLRSEYLHYLRVREWQDLVRQLRRALDERRAPDGPAPTRGGGRTDGGGPDADAIHRAILSGLLGRIGLLDERTVSKGRRGAEYLGSRGQRFAIFPGSSLARRPPRAVMAAELVETSRLFARTLASIDPAWAEPLAGDLAKRTFSEPRWLEREGSAVVDERVTLFGVPIVTGRRVRLGRLDPERARELLIRHALVDGAWPHATRASGLLDFDERNERTRREVREVEERTRRRDLLSDDEAIFAFYDARIPPEVTDTRGFERWWRTARADHPDALTMTAADLAPDAAIDEDRFPSEWHSEDARLAVGYRFEPGADDDGITVDVPLDVLPRIEATGFDWLVPGMRDELVAALIRTLPKSIRRHVVPAGDWARRLAGSLPETPDGVLTERLAAAIRREAGVVIAASDFDPTRLPDHLRVGFAAVDERGRRVGSSKDLGELRQRFADRAARSVARAVTATDPDDEAAGDGIVPRDGLTAFDVDELPAMVERRRGGSVVRAYPALIDQGSSVALRLLPTEAEAERAHRDGIRRLFALATPSPAAYVQAHLTAAEKLALATSPYPSTAALIADAVGAAIDEVAAGRAPRTRTEYERLREEVSVGVVERVFRIVASAAAVLAAARDADRAISAASSISLMSPLSDARAQLDALVHPGFVGTAFMPAGVTDAGGPARLARLPVYLRGIVHRVERVADAPGRDRAWQNEVDEATALYRDAGGALPLARGTDPRLVEVRWALEELRISLFAQPLGASGPVSLPRIRRLLAAASAR